MKSSAKVRWYWHRLWAMSPGEVLLRVQKKRYQYADRTYRPAETFSQARPTSFPSLPPRNAAPDELLTALGKDAREILAGQWKAFGHLPLPVSDPPRWHADNLVGRDLQSGQVAFQLDHRGQPDGADIKVIWEPNRWSQLVRLALAAWLLDHPPAREKCCEWLHDWATRNPPFTGLNWTSGLETGIRLIQFAWIDALLAAAGVPHKALEELRGRILGPHVWYTWRYKSFGSSANNHLIGELAGLIIALARWPELAKISAPLSEIGALLEREIFAQFAEDGGNQEQALGYHLFSWEFCFQAQAALASAGCPLSPEAARWLARAGEFYHDVKLEADVWDFGDSDNAWVTPLFTSESAAAREWWKWFEGGSPALSYWWGNFARSAPEPKPGEWQLFPASGYAVLRTADWFLRFDFSPLGYLSMAPHGHLDALHLSVWYRGQPVVVDPGTGAYYADKNIRAYLADWSAHNGPHLKNPPVEYPKRFGTFLWGEHHKLPQVRLDSPQSISADLDLPYGRATRSITFLPKENKVKVIDGFVMKAGMLPVVTRWKLAPEWPLIQKAPREFLAGPLRITTNDSWKMARTYNPPDEVRGRVAAAVPELGNVPLESLVSPAFRAIASASYLALESTGEGPFELIFSAA